MIVAFHARHEIQNASVPLRLSQKSSSTRSVKLYAANLRLPLNLTVHDLVTLRSASPPLFYKPIRGHPLLALTTFRMNTCKSV
jgi:hypothetical protein